MQARGIIYLVFLVAQLPNIQWLPQLFKHLEFFHVEKSCKSECCGNKAHQIIQNMTLSWGLELKLSLLWKTTVSDQLPLFYRWGKVCEALLPWYFNGSRGLHSFSHLENKGCWPEIVVLHNKLSLSSKPQDSIIFWAIWCVLLPQHSILHELFTWKNSRCSKNSGNHCMLQHSDVD